jgi:hypothetical protein
VSEAAPRVWVRLREALLRRTVRWILSIIMAAVVVGGMSPFLMASLRIEGTRNAMV